MHTITSATLCSVCGRAGCYPGRHGKTRPNRLAAIALVAAVSLGAGTANAAPTHETTSLGFGVNTFVPCGIASPAQIKKQHGCKVVLPPRATAKQIADAKRVGIAQYRAKSGEISRGQKDAADLVVLVAFAAWATVVSIQSIRRGEHRTY